MNLQNYPNLQNYTNLQNLPGGMVRLKGQTTHTLTHSLKGQSGMRFFRRSADFCLFWTKTFISEIDANPLRSQNAYIGTIFRVFFSAPTLIPGQYIVDLEGGEVKIG